MHHTRVRGLSKSGWSREQGIAFVPYGSNRFRKTLEAVCEDRAAQGKDLKARVNDLRTKLTLPSELFEAMDHLRLLGNDAAHIEAKTYDEVGPEEVLAGIDLTKEIIKATYQYKSLLSRLQALKKPPT